MFAQLPSNRDRALVAFYVSTGTRASELLSATQGGVDPGRQLITVIRKGTRAGAELPASTDAFVWLRLYQLEMDGIVPKGRTRPLWWTGSAASASLDVLRGAPHVRAGQQAGWDLDLTLHSLRHTAAYRMEARGIASDASFGRFGDRDSVRDLGFRTGRPARWRRGRHAL